MSVNASVLNSVFTTKLASAEDKVKVAAYAESFIRDRLREVSFLRKILPPEQVTRSDCQVSVNHDTLIKIVEIEPQSKAMVATFRGQPRARFIRAPRAEIGFFTITSEQFQKTEQELLTYQMPITKIIEDNSVKDIQEIEDREFILHVDAACQGLQADANGGTPVELSWSSLNPTTPGTAPPVEFSIRKGELARSAGSNSALIHPIQRGDIIAGKNMLDGNRLHPETMLMGETDWNNVLLWNIMDFGSQLQSETTVEGYKHNMLMGLKYIRTIKLDILRPGNIYFFTDPGFFGRFYVLNNTKFYIDKIANTITFQAWEDIGMGLINIAAVRKIELYSANANPNAGDDTFIENFIPVTEDALGAVNNRVDQGLKFPQIQSF